jgi:pantoate--beta-alanine ligase
MERVAEPEALRAICDRARGEGKRVGFVPTMGALHAGHLSLVERARERADHVVVSIFVNPTQFGPGEDLDQYPRTLEDDCAACEAAGVATVFAPGEDAMYPPGDQTRVRVDAMTKDLCGAHRPEHFEGVATVVTKLFGVVGPCVAVFGRKDYQQWRVICRLVRDLFLPVEVVGAPTVREDDGLALSSRNRYLSDEERARALSIPRSLSAAVRAFEAGERSVKRLTSSVTSELAAAMDAVDYVSMADADGLSLLAADAEASDRALLAVAARVGGTRLIDNVVLGEDPAPLQP